MDIIKAQQENLCPKLKLRDQAHLAGWPTATVNDSTGSEYAYSQGDHNKKVLKLPGAARLAGWPTCSARDHKGEGHQKELTNSRPLNEVARGVTPGGSLAKTDGKEGYRLNPHFSRWLMGFPAEWLSSKVLEMLSSRKSRRSS
jgi:hypothetical protein